MQKTSHNLGHAKHHQAFGKGNRNKTNNLLTARDINERSDQNKKIAERKKNPMVPNVRELFGKR